MTLLLISNPRRKRYLFQDVYVRLLFMIMKTYSNICLLCALREPRTQLTLFAHGVLSNVGEKEIGYEIIRLSGSIFERIFYGKCN